MTALVDLQRQMAAAIRGTAREAPIDVFRPANLPEGEPLSVYRNHHRISLCAALATTFPTVVRLIGEEAFRVLASRFLHAQPPVQPCLAEYGAAFGQYLEVEILVKDLPYLADMARLDWAINQATTAPDVEALEAGLLGSLSPDELAELCVRPHPSLTLLWSNFPLSDIYQLAYGADAVESITLESGSVRLMIWRHHNGTMTASVSEQVFEALKGLACGGQIRSACEKLSQAELPAFFASYILGGGFVKCSPGEVAGHDLAHASAA
jgi:hypothetical protein